ncbi:MAG: hypothetical protein U9N79_02825 [Actinomycetota bacterium]|nr:hypothetical protein [Actinomycetota bacterium]
MKRVIFAVVALVVLVAAAQPADVAPVLEAQGFFVEDGSDADPDAIENAVAEARFAGGNLSVAVLAVEPSGGAPIFAEITLDEMGGTGTVFVVAPETVGWDSEADIYTRAQLDEATDVSLDGSSDTEVVELFVATLIGQPVGGAEPGGGGGLRLGWIFLLIVIAGGALVLWLSSRSSKKDAAQAIENARVEVKKRLDDVANDIIDLEDEVAVSQDPAVPVLYASATEAYAEALDTYQGAASPQELIATAEDLDMAIWRLDSVEALLDGKTPPPKPQKPRPAAQVPGASPSSTPPAYRRPDRHRSSGTAAMMTGLLMGSMASSRRSPRRSPRSGSRSRSTGSTRMRGGGRRRG